MSRRSSKFFKVPELIYKIAIQRLEHQQIDYQCHKKTSNSPKKTFKTATQMIENQQIGCQYTQYAFQIPKKSYKIAMQCSEIRKKSVSSYIFWKSNETI